MIVANQEEQVDVQKTIPTIRPMTRPGRWLTAMGYTSWEGGAMSTSRKGHAA